MERAAEAPCSAALLLYRYLANRCSIPAMPNYQTRDFTRDMGVHSKLMAALLRFNHPSIRLTAARATLPLHPEGACCLLQAGKAAQHSMELDEIFAELDRAWQFNLLGYLTCGYLINVPLSHKPMAGAAATARAVVGSTDENKAFDLLRNSLVLQRAGSSPEAIPALTSGADALSSLI